MASYQYGTPNDPKKSGQGSQGSSGKQPQKEDRDSWVSIVILFAIASFGLWPLYLPAVFKLIRKISDLSHQYRSEVSQAQPNDRSTAQNIKTGTRRAKKSRTDNPNGLGLMIGGGIMAGIFAIATTVSSLEFFESLFYGYFFGDELSAVLVCFMFMLAGFALLLSGVNSRRARERYTGYLAYIGANREVNLAYMAASFNVSVKKLCKDLRTMLAKGILPTGYLDLSAGKLFLTEMGYRAPEKTPDKDKEAKAPEQSDSAILLEIRQVNDAIPDQVMSKQIDRIEEITGKILTYQRTHPDKSGELRSFLNYYLPTTLKILRAYAQLDAQGIEGENISAAKARIEGMMDQVVSGFEKQLDKLFQDAAMDINSDVQVLENMLKKDGLSDDSEGMTMTL